MHRNNIYKLIIVLICTLIYTIHISHAYTHTQQQQHETHANTNVNAPLTPGFITYDQLGGYPYEVGFDERAITINGTRSLFLSGSIHYPRSVPEQWKNILNLTKASGLNTVQLYVFWNIHEVTPGNYDFETYNRNLPLFLQLIAEAGLFAFVRIGGYVCAEWTYGAIPTFLRLDGMEFRSMDPRWLVAQKAFVAKILDVMDPYLSKNGGPVFMAQIENEYGNIEGAYPDGPQYVDWCANTAHALEPTINWVMCQQDSLPVADSSFIINTCNGFYCDNWISGHKSNFPNSPPGYTENWVGWFQNWGNPKPYRPAQDAAFSVARWFQRGGSFHNYYMFHGGTTFERLTGGPSIVTSYDYDAPIDEYGVIHPVKYNHLTKLHKLMSQYSQYLVNNDIPKPTSPCNNCEIHVYGTAGVVGIAFLANWDTSSNYTITFSNKQFVLSAWTCTIVDAGTLEILYITSDVPAGNPFPVQREGSVPSFPAQYDWITESIGIWDMNSAIFATGPLEQINATLGTTDYLWYSTNVSFTQNQINDGSSILTLSNSGDLEYVYLNGVYQNVFSSIGDSGTGKISLNISSLSPNVNYPLAFLSTTIGYDNYGSNLERVTRGLNGQILIDGANIANGVFAHNIGLQGEINEYFNAGNTVLQEQKDKQSIEPHFAVMSTDSIEVSIEATAARINWTDSLIQPNTFTALTWYYFRIPTPEPHAPTQNALMPTWQLDLGGMGKGLAWVNGFLIGRYWNITAEGDCTPCDWRGDYSGSKCLYDCGVPSVQYYHIPNIRPAGYENVIVLFEEIGGDPMTVNIIQRN